MSSLEAFRRLMITAETRGVDQAANALDKLAAAENKVTVAADNTTRATENMQRRIDGLQRTLDEDFRNKERLARAETTISNARSQGIISLDRQNQLLTLARQRYGEVANENDRFAKSTNASRYAMQSLGFQINDVATMLAMGSSPFQVLASQGGQIFQVYQQSPTVFGDLARSIASVITPTRLLMAGLAAVGLSGFALFDRWENGQIRLQRALEGTGREAGVTRSRLNEMAEQSARRAGGSIGDARDTLAALANTGRIAPDMLGPIADQRRNVAATWFNNDAAQANEFLAKSFADPIRGYELLTERVGGATEAGRRNIRMMVEAGEADRARAEMLQLLIQRVGDYNKLTSTGSRTGDTISSAFWNSIDRFSAYGAAEFEKMQERNRAARAAARAAEPPPGTRELESQIRLLEENRRHLEANPNLWGDSERGAQRYQQRLAEVNRDLAEATRKLNELRSGSTTLATAIVYTRGARSEGAETERDNRRLRQGDIDAGARNAETMGQGLLQQQRRLDDLYNRYETARKAADALYQLQGDPARQAERTARQGEMRDLRREIEERVNSRRGIFDRSGNFRITREELAGRATTPAEDFIDRSDRQRSIDDAQYRGSRSARRGAAQDSTRMMLEGNSRIDQAEYDARIRRAGEDSDYAINRSLRIANSERERYARSAIDGVRRQADAQQQGTQAVEAARFQQMLLSQATQEYGQYGERVPMALRDRFRELGDEMAREVVRANELRAAADLTFERMMIGMSPGEQNVARLGRSIYGENWQSMLDGPTLSMARMNEQLKEGSQLASGFFQDLYQGARNSKGGFDFVAQAFLRMLDRMVVAQLDALAKGLFNFGGGAGAFNPLSLIGGLFGGGGGAAGGAAAFTGTTGTGWSGGGYTGPGAVNQFGGFVHKGEVVFSQRDVARHGGPAAVDAMRLGLAGYAAGGIAGGRPANTNVPMGGRPVRVTMINAHGGAQVDEKHDDQGNVTLTVSDVRKQMNAANARDIAARRSEVADAMAVAYRLNQQPVVG